MSFKDLIKKNFLEKKNFNRLPVFLIILSAIIIIALIVLVLSNTNQTIEKSLTIDILEPASSIRAAGDYDKKTSFGKNESAYIYQEFSNFIVTNNKTKCNLYLNITVYHNDIKFFNDSYHLTDYKSSIDSKVVDAFKWPINFDNTWPTGKYEVFASIKDKYSGETASSTTNFNLV